MVQLDNLTWRKTKIIIGNPGCGKTTRLIKELKKLVGKGVPLQEIGFCSFSVAAIQVAIERSLKKLLDDGQTISAKDLPYFKTLHAMAYHLLGLSPENLINDYQLQEFGNLCGYKMSGTNNNVSAVRLLQGDRMLNLINAARLLNVPIREYATKNNAFSYPVNNLEDLAYQYESYKVMNELYDYTDMLVLAKNADLEFPQLKCLFVDEAQDLSTLQWILVNRMAKFADKVIIAGDDKQSINAFSGADVNTFLNIKGRVEVLSQSYRVPKRVYALANRIMRHMWDYRIEGAEWKPKEEEGVVVETEDFPYNELKKGEWFILCRATYHLDLIKQKLLAMEEPPFFTSGGGWPVSHEAYEVADMLRTARNKGLSMRDSVIIKDSDSDNERKNKIDIIRKLKKYVTFQGEQCQYWEVNEDFIKRIESPWYTAMDKLTPLEKNYIRKTFDAFRRYGVNMMDKKATIRCMTMHSAKGMECDNVLVILDAPRAAQETIRYNDSDVEAKVLYVAVTRARKKLYLYKINKYGISLDEYL